METNEVMANEEVIETATEEIAKASSGCGFKTVTGFGLGILAGVAICKLAKPVMSRIKARKESADVVVDVDVTVEDAEVDETEKESED